MNNKAHLRPKDFDSSGDIIPMSWKEEKLQGERLTPWEQVCRIAQSCGYNEAKVRGKENG